MKRVLIILFVVVIIFLGGCEVSEKEREKIKEEVKQEIKAEEKAEIEKQQQEIEKKETQGDFVIERGIKNDSEGNAYYTVVVESEDGKQTRIILDKETYDNALGAYIDPSKYEEFKE